MTLTNRELEILGMYAQGIGFSEIAERLYLSGYTVRNHVTHLRKKLGARTVAHAVAIAYEEQILP